MQLQHNPMTIERYLQHYNYAIIRDDGKHKLVQLNNLKLVEIELREDNSYIIQEVTLGQVGEYWEDIGIETVIEHIQMLEGSNDTFSSCRVTRHDKIWHVDDVLSINSTLSRNHARLILTMAMDNHDANIGINWEVLTEYIDRVLEMEAAGII
jgi:hypothetical protein